MRFLCPNHEKSLSLRTEEHLTSQWIDWMFTAGAHYQYQDWEEALRYTGNALDLAKIRLRKTPSRPRDTMSQLALSAIYLSNIFQHLGFTREADNALAKAKDYLRLFRWQDEPCAQEFLLSLHDKAHHGYLIDTALSLPYRDCGARGTSTLH